MKNTNFILKMGGIFITIFMTFAVGGATIVEASTLAEPIDIRFQKLDDASFDETPVDEDSATLIDGPGCQYGAELSVEPGKIISKKAKTAYGEVEFMKIVLTAPNECDVVLDSIVFSRVGSVADLPVAYAHLDLNGEPITDTVLMLGDGIFDFGDVNINIEAGTSIELTLKGVGFSSSGKQFTDFSLMSGGIHAVDVLGNPFILLAGVFPITNNTRGIAQK